MQFITCTVGITAPTTLIEWEYMYESTRGGTVYIEIKQRTYRFSNRFTHARECARTHTQMRLISESFTSVYFIKLQGWMDFTFVRYTFILWAKWIRILIKAENIIMVIIIFILRDSIRCGSIAIYISIVPHFIFQQSTPASSFSTSTFTWSLDLVRVLRPSHLWRSSQLQFWISSFLITFTYYFNVIHSIASYHAWTSQWIKRK